MCLYLGEKISMAREQDQLLIEAHQINYRLRSTFFYRKIREYNVLAFPSLVASLFPTGNLYNWDQRTDWGISEEAFTYIQQGSNLHLIQVFCHPRLLREYPMLLAYYRNIAALSQKAVGYLIGIDVKRYEDVAATSTLNSQQILSLVSLFNEHISLVIDSSVQSFDEKELNALLLASTGAQIDGAWRNAIGEEAEKVVQRLLIKEAVKRNMLVAFLLKPPAIGIESYEVTKLEEQLRSTERYRGVVFSNQTSLLFSSEPDIAMVGKQGQTLGVLEIKGGTDPAGALERYGAAKKSFEKTLQDAPNARTILIASCITSEVQKRIARDATISEYFNLTEVLKEQEKYHELLNLVFSILTDQ
ncbi:MAG TPA: hypothetical protein DHW02_13640 [Ktedonobacter sp.]|nr:hypothetical protein [Ktedonobacter sp.]